MFGGGEVRGKLNKLIRDELQDFSYRVDSFREASQLHFTTHCTLSNEESREVFGPLQIKKGIFKDKLVD